MASGAQSPDRRRTLALLLALPVAGSPIFSTAAPGNLAAPTKHHDTQADHEFLNQDEYHLVSVVSDLMLPTTDTPGAIAAGVPEFIDRFLAKWNTASERAHFRSELQGIDVIARATFRRPFLKLEVSAQYEVLRQLEEQSLGSPPGVLLTGYKPFFRLMKEYLVVGYYTSEVGAGQELRWTPIPGQYLGCTPCADRDARAAAPL